MDDLKNQDLEKASGGMVGPGLNGNIELSFLVAGRKTNWENDAKSIARDCKEYGYSGPEFFLAYRIHQNLIEANKNPATVDISFTGGAFPAFWIDVT